MVKTGGGELLHFHFEFSPQNSCSLKLIVRVDSTLVLNPKVAETDGRLKKHRASLTARQG